MTVYEGMFILDSTKYSRDPDAVTGQLNDLVTEHGGTVLVSQLWDERKLAYPINGQRKGSYWLIYFSIDGTNLVAFERQCELNENVLRRLILKIGLPVWLSHLSSMHKPGTAARNQHKQLPSQMTSHYKEQPAKYGA